MLTVFGHQGFIGSHIVRELNKRKLNYFLPKRDENINDKDLGKIIYCIGLTADAKKKPFETIDAHINKLSEIVKHGRFEDITYASSARIYVHNSEIATEESFILVDVADPFELFNLTKLTAESLLTNTVEKFKSVRYSNVYGIDLSSENFLTSIIKEAVATGKVTLYSTQDSSKDYISVIDAAKLTVDIALSNKPGIYNVASGINISNKEITDRISKKTGCEVIYSEKANKIVFPLIDISRIKEAFQFKQAASLMDDIDSIIIAFEEDLK